MVQSINLDAMLYFPWVRFIRKSLAIPHFSITDISKINPEKIKYYGFKGLVFDKDNTITAPYKNEIYPTVQKTFSQLKSLYGNKMVIVSNSAGTRDDKNYEDAKRIESDLGIAVLRHDRKKPGSIAEMEKYFGCKSNELVMIGDRIFTDVVFGNRYGMLTIHIALLTEEGENKAASMVRRYELSLIKEWIKRGISAPQHKNYHPDICLENLMNNF